jgi:hypothetical protein
VRWQPGQHWLITNSVRQISCSAARTGSLLEKDGLTYFPAYHHDRMSLLNAVHWSPPPLDLTLQVSAIHPDLKSASALS